MRRLLITVAGLVLVSVIGEAQGPTTPTRGRARQGSGARFTVVESTIPAMRAALERGETTSREIVRQSLVRIALHEDRLNAAITINPRALEEADARDRERRLGRIRGPLHGIPIALKDNIQTTDMPTTGGALAFADFVPPYDATLTRHLRDAGAIILAKTVMTELANWVAPGMPANYGSLAGFAFNPYDPRRDMGPRADGRPLLSTGGSSSGIGTAASFWVANVGTETSGSILNPASQTMLAAVKPTVGRISRYGVIPITADQDTPGPMARSVTDAAILLGVLEGRTPDPNDPATRACTPPPGQDYTRFLKRDALKGARIGIPRAFFYDGLVRAGSDRPVGGLSPARKAVMADAIAALRAQGALIVDPVEIPSVTTKDDSASLLNWDLCSAPDNPKGKDANCSVVLKYGMKRDFNAWLVSLGPTAPVKTLTGLRAWNRAHERMGTLKYGQAQLDVSDEMDVDADRSRYLADREKDLTLTARQGLDVALRAHNLDALLFPGSMGADIAARPGYPTVIVPFGVAPFGPPPAGAITPGAVSSAAPQPPVSRPALSPIGVSFTGAACSEPRLLALAYAFEQATHRRAAPDLK